MTFKRSKLVNFSDQSEFTDHGFIDKNIEKKDYFTSWDINVLSTFTSKSA